MSYRESVASRVLLLALLLGGPAACKGARARVPPPPLPPPAALSAAEIGDRHYAQREFPEAVTAYEQALAEADDPAASPSVTFRLAMAYLGLDPGLEGQSRAVELLRDHSLPASELPPEAAVLLQLLETLEQVRGELNDSRRQVRRLNTELEKLREIDLKRRPPQ